MIPFVLVHLGGDLPPHMYDAINCLISRYNTDIYVIALRSAIQNASFLSKIVKVVPVEDLSSFEKNKIFEKISFIEKGLWTYSFQRFFLIESFMRAYCLEKILHIENDVLVYNNAETIADKLHKHATGKVAVNTIGPKYASAAYIYIDSSDSIGKMNEELLSILSK